MELKQFELIVKNGLDFGPKVGSVAVRPSPQGPNLQRATCNYSKGKVPHAVHLDFDSSGRVFNIDVAVSSKNQVAA